MANRIIYQSDALYASNNVRATGLDQHVQIRRVQSANYSFSVNRTDVFQFGSLARIDSTILESPTITADLSYLLGDGFNEIVLGFSDCGNPDSAPTGFVKNQIAADTEQATSGINLYVLTTPEGEDANVARSAATEDYSTIGLGNMYVSDYTLDASVGDFPTVSVTLEGLNANSTTGVMGITGGSETAPEVTGFVGVSGVGVNPVDGTKHPNFVTDGTQLSLTDYLAEGTGAEYTGAVRLPAPSQSTGTSIINALKPGDMELAIAQGKSFFNIDPANSVSGGHVQSISLSVPLSRTPLERLGSTFAFARPADFPITPSLSISAVVNQAQQQALTSIVGSDGFIDKLSFKFKDSAGVGAVRYELRNLKLDSESVSSSIGPNKTVDLSFSVSVGGPNDNKNNVFFSGAARASHNTDLFG